MASNYRSVAFEAPESAIPANNLLNTIIKTYDLKNDAALSRFLGVAPTIISKIRHGNYKISGGMIIRIHELTDWSVASIKAKLGLPSAAEKVAS